MPKKHGVVVDVRGVLGSPPSIAGGNAAVKLAVSPRSWRALVAVIGSGKEFRDFITFVGRGG